ncbi:hypothetical protein J6590_046788 [Homalodisca vitripennis]|nr:hypothetical protein J6590_046788 [Homalodisca vitripennis]
MARSVHFWLVYTFQLNVHWAQQNPMCHLNMGNHMESWSGTSLTANIEVLGCKGKSIGLVNCGDDCYPRHGNVSSLPALPGEAGFFWGGGCVLVTAVASPSSKEAWLKIMAKIVPHGSSSCHSEGAQSSY